MSIQIVCGVEQVKKSPLRPYSDLICEFLDEFSSELRKDNEARNYPDVQTFAFWARKSNIQKKKQEFERRAQSLSCIGRGIVFHILILVDISHSGSPHESSYSVPKKKKG